MQFEFKTKNDNEDIDLKINTKINTEEVVKGV